MRRRRGGAERLNPRIGFRVSCRRLHNRFERLPLRFHSNVRIMLQHSLRDVPCNVPDGLVPCPAFRKIGDERVPVVMPTPAYAGLLPNVIP